jgi:hypothetical protein
MAPLPATIVVLHRVSVNGNTDRGHRRARLKRS